MLDDLVGEPPRLAGLPEGDQHREVFAAAGLALYQARVLEQALKHVLLFAQLADGTLRPERGALADFLGGPGRRPIGPILQALRRHVAFEQDVDQMCESARDTRNLVVHTFFYERAERFASTRGRQALVDELFDAAATFSRAEQTLAGLLFTLSERFGVTPDGVEAKVRSMWRDAGGAS